MFAPNTCSFHVEIPLDNESAQLFCRAVGLVSRHLDPRTHSDDPLDATYERTLAGDPPPRDNDPQLAEVAEAIIRRMFQNASDEKDLILDPKQMRWATRLKSPGVESAVMLSTRSYAWGRVNLACALVEAAQEALGAPPVGFSFYSSLDGHSGAGAVAIAPGREATVMDLDRWIDQELKGAGQAAPRRAAEAAPEAGM